MGTLQERIIEKLVAELSEKKALSAEKLTTLRELLQKKDAKLRPETLVDIFTRDDGEVA
jgi:hypothetical protein